MTTEKENIVVCEGEDVAAYLDSELDADATLRFEEHLAACPLCRTKLREQRSLLCALDVALNDKRSVALPTDFARVIAANAKSDMGGVFDVAERKRALLFCVMLALSSFILLGAAMREQRRRLAVLRNERTRLGSEREVLLDLLTLVVVYRVERVRAQKLVELAATQLSCHGPATPLSTSASRSRLSPERIRLFTVPSGSPSTTATSR